MLTQFPIRAIIDTNVVFDGLTRQGGACGLIIDAWRAGLFRPFVSNALAYEYAEVLSRMLSSERWQRIQPVLGRLLEQSEFVTVYFRWRPSSPDPGDEHVIDCAMNAGASVVTDNVRDFHMAKQALGLQVMTPMEFVEQLSSV